jgi:hypothetical protein
VQEGKSLDAIKKDLRTPEHDGCSGGKERLDTNIDAAYRTVKKSAREGAERVQHVYA